MTCNGNLLFEFLNMKCACTLRLAVIRFNATLPV